MRGEFVDIAGARLYYYAAGTRGGGEPIVFLHGFPTSSHLWHETVRHIPAGHRVVVLDLLGFGRSDRPAGRPVTLEGHAARVVALLDELRIGACTVVGHDIGGGVALLLALRWPARVSRLCLIDTVAFDGWPSRAVRMARATLPVARRLPPSVLLSAVRTELLRGYSSHDLATHSVERYLKPFATPEGRDALVEHLLSLDASETAAIAPSLPALAQPTAIAWGADDPFLPVELGRRLQAALPHATLDVVPGGRHFLPEEHPERVAEVLGALLARQAP